MKAIYMDTPEDRAMMTRKDIGLEMVRMKREKPVQVLSTGAIYASTSELARSMGMTPQTLYKRMKSRSNYMKYHIIDEDSHVRYPPYLDLHACQNVDEYIAHYVRKYYPEFIPAMAPRMSLNGITSQINYRKLIGLPELLRLDGDIIYDVYDDPDNPVFVCNTTDIGE